MINLSRQESSDQKYLVATISYGTFSSHMNYGAVLHAYAFQQILFNLGCDSIIIDYIASSMENYSLKYPIRNIIYIKSPSRFIYYLINWSIGFYANIRKYNKFGDFINSYFKKTKHVYKFSDLESLESIEGLNINTFVCESDVIWKLYSAGTFDRGFFLAFPSASGKRKVAYAPSIGSELFSDEQICLFKKYTRDFYAISLRERVGAEYISKILGKNIDWVLDPTLLLPCEHYSKLAISPTESHYVLLYNCMKNDQSMVKEAERFAKLKGLKLIEISNFSINNFLNHHKVITDAGIEEWLGYIKQADYVICNAFHGFCFSVIFRKNFFVFQRNDSDYRMQNLAEALGLQERLIGLGKRDIPNEFALIDYDTVYKRLDILRMKSYDFIKKNIIQ